MRLSEFLENFDVMSDVVVLYYGSIEYSGKIKDIPFKKMVGRTVQPGLTAFSDNIMIISVENEIKKDRNYDVVLAIQDDLTEDLFPQW